jgi:copper chaperone
MREEGGARSEGITGPARREDRMAKAVLSIEGMTCNHCVMRVQKALASIPGVDRAVVTLQPGQARVEYDDATASTQAMADAVAQAGYAASVAGQ